MENQGVIAVLMHLVQHAQNHEERIHRVSIQCLALEEAVLRFVPDELRSQYKSRIDALSLSTEPAGTLIFQQAKDDMEVLRRCLES
jgi:hypothetical protein